MTVQSVLRRSFVGALGMMSTLAGVVPVHDCVEASRRADFGVRARHPIVVGIHAALTAVASAMTELRGMMTWVATRHLQLSAVRR